MSAPASPGLAGLGAAPAEAPAKVPLPAEPGPRKRRSGSQKRQRGKGAVLVSLLPAERALAEEKAGAAGLSLSAYGRACMLGDAGPRARRRLSVDRAALAHAVAEFNRAGGNLNQIARALNELLARDEGRGRLTELVAELAGPMRDLHGAFAVALAAILAALGHERADDRQG